MKIKRFSGTDMRQAIRKVREALGPDAVILSNHKTAEGVEVVAAVDYDESLLESMPATQTRKTASAAKQDAAREAAWDDVRYARNIPPNTAAKPAASQPAPAQVSVKIADDPTFLQMQNELKSLRGLLVNQLSGLAWENETRYHPLRARLLQRLLALGLSPQLAREITEKVDEQDDFEHNWRMALGVLSHRVPVLDDTILNQQQSIIAIVGPTGVGKTTTVAKLAARYLLRHGKRRIGLITTDNYRVAAHEQLRSYARIMGAPMRVAADTDALRDALAAFRDKDLVLIDTAGMSQRDMRLNEQFSLLREAGHPVQAYLTLAANSQRGVLSDVARAFQAVPLAGCILTKLDETTSLGGCLAIAVEQNLPVAYISDGQQVPEDLHPARAHALVSRAVAIMQEVGVGVRNDPVSTLIGGMAAHAHG